MKRIDLLIDDRCFMGANCPDEDVVPILNWLKKSDIFDCNGTSLKSKCKIDVSDIPNPRPQPTAVPTRKEIKLVEFLNWGKKL